MKRIASIVAFTAVVLAAVVALQSRPAPVPATADHAATTAPAYSAGYKVQLDYAGNITDEAPPIDESKFPQSVRAALSTSSEGLVERRSAVAGGGIEVDLQGRFQSTSVARVKADGTIEAPCLTNTEELDKFEAAGTAGDESGEE